MTAFKAFSSNDVVITPFDLSKNHSLSGGEIINPELGIEFYTGINHEITPGTFFDFDNNQTGINFFQNTLGIYNSIKQLYYNPSQFSELYLQSSLYYTRYFPTSSESEISVISIPMLNYGENILPSTFKFSYELSSTEYSLEDDGEGNIIDSNEDIVGNIFYSHGIITLTSGSYVQLSSQMSSSLLDNTVLEFSSTYRVKEHQYKCVINSHEFQTSTNPTLIQENSFEYKDLIYEDYFSPYVTTVGLYNNKMELVAVGKLSFPLPISKVYDTTIIVNFDIN